MNNDKLNVLVLFGGRSGEHEISLQSARSVVANLDPGRYRLILVGISKEGRWFRPRECGKVLERKDGLQGAEGDPILLPVDRGEGVLLVKSSDAWKEEARIDVVFPVLHGTFGEDGSLQGMLDLAGVPYVGSGVLGSAAGMDKAVMKRLFRVAGLPIVDSLTFSRRRWEKEEVGLRREVAGKIGFPCFVKPANLGSSVGISKARDENELAGAIRVAAEYDYRVVVEKAVPEAREIECAVLGNEEPEASILGEVIPGREFYDYAAKYLEDTSRLIIPAELPVDQGEFIRRLAIKAFTAVDCAGMARVDFLVSGGTGEVFVNEVNTIPGFTSISMYPKLWEATGLPYSRLLDRLIELALERHAERAKNRTSYQPG